jgi:hypothetical protein
MISRSSTWQWAAQLSLLGCLWCSLGSVMATVPGPCTWIDSNITSVSDILPNGQSGDAGAVMVTTNVYLVYYGDSWTNNTLATTVRSAEQRALTRWSLV